MAWMNFCEKAARLQLGKELTHTTTDIERIIHIHTILTHDQAHALITPQADVPRLTINSVSQRDVFQCDSPREKST